MSRLLDVAVVGGGPVGLFLGLLLVKQGFFVRVFDRREAPRLESRSIGIHPVSLECFAGAGIVHTFLQRGRRIRRGRVFTGSRQIGTLSFATCPPPYPFILTLPQKETEYVLEAELHRASPDVLCRGEEVEGIVQDADGVEVAVRSVHCSKVRVVRARFAVGCDGHQSHVRKSVGISVRGSPYPDSFCMGDFLDGGQFEADACVFLCREGLVESFPLPGNQRRWVISTEARWKDPTASPMAEVIHRRTGVSVDIESNRYMSAFGVQREIVDQAISGRVLLAGDAAHVMTPIGGQGMNVGWMDAYDAAEVLAQVLTDSFEDTDTRLRLRSYNDRVLLRASRAVEQAEWNMCFGRADRAWWWRKLLAHLILLPGVRGGFARAFTMRRL